MKITVKEYNELVKNQSPNSPHFKNFIWAFFIGGLICSMSETFFYIFTSLGIEEDNARLLASVTLIFEAAILTGFGIYDEIGRFGGAGCTVPISGFANSIASAAMEFRREGLIYGVGAKIFTIAGPVILYGTMASIVVGIIYYLVG